MKTTRKKERNNKHKANQNTTLSQVKYEDTFKENNINSVKYIAKY